MAQIGIGFKEVGTIVQCITMQLELLCNDIEYGCLTGAIAAIQNGDWLKIQPTETALGQNLKGIKGIITGSAFIQKEAVFLFRRGKGKTGQIQHHGITS